MENDEEVSPFSDELRSALVLFTQYLRMRKVALDFREAGVLRSAVARNIALGGTVALIHGENGLEFRIISKVKEIKPTKPRSKSGESKPRSRQQKAAPGA